MRNWISSVTYKVLDQGLLIPTKNSFESLHEIFFFIFFQSFNSCQEEKPLIGTNISKIFLSYIYSSSFHYFIFLKILTFSLLHPLILRHEAYFLIQSILFFFEIPNFKLVNDFLVFIFHRCLPSSQMLHLAISQCQFLLHLWL